jgi:hypothetical protein
MKKPIILKLSAYVRYWEDAIVNGQPDTESGDNIPCKDGDRWCPEIEIDTGKITNWEQGKTADIHYKVCDECSWEVVFDNDERLIVQDSYVPGSLCPKEKGYGDYIIMDISENGQIDNWAFNLEHFHP